jgi:hypothetical protein
MRFSPQWAHALIRLNRLQPSRVVVVNDGFASFLLFVPLFKVVFIKWIEGRYFASYFDMATNLGVCCVFQKKRLWFAVFVFDRAVEPPVIPT